MAGDAVEPGSEQEPPAEALQALEGLEEGGLMDVLGQVRIVHHLAAEAVERRAIGLHKDGEGTVPVAPGQGFACLLLGIVTRCLGRSLGRSRAVARARRHVLSRLPREPAPAISGRLHAIERAIGAHGFPLS